MTYEQFYTLVGAASEDQECDVFVSDWALSSIWGEDANLEQLAPQLQNIWDVVHMDINDLRAITGLTQAAFSKRFLFPQRTVETWSVHKFRCPIYTRMMIADILGLIRVQRDG